MGLLGYEKTESNSVPGGWGVTRAPVLGAAFDMVTKVVAASCVRAVLLSQKDVPPSPFMPVVWDGTG